ncbi:hypothetical protein ACU4GD_43595 [Cupriavidus basilensis]
MNKAAKLEQHAHLAPHGYQGPAAVQGGNIGTGVKSASGPFCGRT